MTQEETAARNRGDDLASPAEHSTVGGMTIREDFALQFTAIYLPASPDHAARRGVQAADALLLELQKGRDA